MTFFNILVDLLCLSVFYYSLMTNQCLNPGSCKRKVKTEDKRSNSMYLLEQQKTAFNIKAIKTIHHERSSQRHQSKHRTQKCTQKSYGSHLMSNRPWQWAPNLMWGMLWGMWQLPIWLVQINTWSMQIISRHERTFCPQFQWWFCQKIWSYFLVVWKFLRCILRHLSISP